jgi:hypothetical protein
MMHRQPGFSHQDQREDVRAKRKSAKAIRRQQRRQARERRAFESMSTMDLQQPVRSS